MTADANDFADVQRKWAGFAAEFTDDVGGDRLAEEIVEYVQRLTSHLRILKFIVSFVGNESRAGDPADGVHFCCVGARDHSPR